MEFSAAQVRALKDFFNDFFNRPPLSLEAKSMAMETGEQLQSLGQNLQEYVKKIDDYPFLAALREPLEVISWSPCRNSPPFPTRCRLKSGKFSAGAATMSGSRA